MIGLSSLLFTFMLLLLAGSYFSGLIAILGYSDEALLGLAFVSLFVPVIVKGRLPPFLGILIAYLIYSFYTSITSQFSPDLLNAFLQSLIHTKLFVVSYSASLVFQHLRFNSILVPRFFWGAIILFILALALNFLLGERWNYLISSEAVQYRYGFVRPSGIFGHYAPNGYFFSLVLVTIFMLGTKTTKINTRQQIQKFFTLVAIDFLAAFPLTVRKGLFMVVPYGLYVISLLTPVRKLLFTTAGSLFLLAFAMLIADTEMYADTVANVMQFFTDDHAYLRGLIVYYGFSLFFDFFPFGVGNGLYGTYFSNENYSVYEYVGLNPDIFIRDNGALSAVYDSGIAALAAEAGFLGCLLYIALLIAYYRFHKLNLDPQNYRIFKILTGFAILLSITEPVWQNGFFTAFYTLCILYIYTKNDHYIINGKWMRQRVAKVMHHEHQVV